MFIRAVNILRTETDLPPFCASCRAGDIIHAIYLIHVSTFHAEIRSPGPAIFKSFLPNLYRFTFNRFHIFIQFCNEQPVLAMDYIYFTVIIEKQSRIIQILRKYRPLPRSFRLIGYANREMTLFVSPPFRRTKTDIKLTVMVAYRCCPRTIHVHCSSLHVKTWVLIITIDRIAGHFPIDQILRHGNRTSGHIIHTCRHEIELIVHPNNIWVRPVTPHDRIRKSPVAVVRIPNLLRFHNITSHQ